MYLIVTTPTKAHQVAFVMGTAFGQRHDVVYFFDRCKPPVSKALLTQRMHLDIATAYSLPRSAVAFADVIVPFVLVIPLCHKRLVLGAVLTTLDSKQRTAWVCTATARFSGHKISSHFNAKSPWRIAPSKALVFLFCCKIKGPLKELTFKSPIWSRRHEYYNTNSEKCKGKCVPWNKAIVLFELAVAFYKNRGSCCDAVQESLLLFFLLIISYHKAFLIARGQKRHLRTTFVFFKKIF